MASSSTGSGTSPTYRTTDRSTSTAGERNSVSSHVTQRHDFGLKHIDEQELSTRQPAHLSPAHTFISSSPSPSGSLSRRSRYSGSESGAFNSCPGIEPVESQTALAFQHAAGTENRGLECPTSAVIASGRAPSYHETIKVESRQLSTFDIACLILNKMVGTGIFTTPGYVLALTHDKGLSLFLWAAGGAYVILCLIIYLDYGTAMPFNGGELIYFNKVWPRPKLFSAILFSVYFIVFGHTSGNAVAFARHVVLTANPPPPLPADGTRPGPPVFDSRIMNLIALSILGLVCLLHYFTKRLGLFLNRVSALYKVILLFTVASLAIRNRQKHIDFDWQNRSPPDFNAFDSVSGFIYVVYSYSGWENSNYVVGELKAKPKYFRLGAFIALALVTTGYILIALGYYLACSTLNIENGQDLGIAMVLGPTFGYKGAQKGLQVCIAISAFGNLIAEVYTSCRVKQAIALHNFLPFSKFFAADSKSFGTPGGALLLHWICSAIVIVSIPSTGDGYSFVIGLFTYGQLAVGVVMGVFYCVLDKQLDYPKPEVWNPIFRTFWPTFIVGYLLAFTNLMLLFAAAWPTGAGLIPRYYWSITLAAVIVFSLLYCLLIKKMLGRFGKRVGCVTHVEDIPDTDDFQMMQKAHRRDGAQWKIEWILEDQRHHRFVRLLNTTGRFLMWIASYL